MIDREAPMMHQGRAKETIQSCAASASDSQAKWVLLAALAYSYPLAALFGASDGSVAMSAIPTIVALIIASTIGGIRVSPKTSISIIFISAAILSANAIVWLTGGVGDAQKMITFNGVILIFGTMLAFSTAVPEIVQNLDRALMLLGVLAVMIFVTNVSEYDAGRLTYGDSNPIWMGRLFGIASIGALYALIMGRVHFAIAGPMLMIFFAAMTLTGSRGPVLAFIFVACVAFVISPIRYKYTIMFIGVFLTVFFALVLELWNGGLLARGLSVGQSDDVSYFIRLDMFEYSKFLISTFPQGIGIGNFSFMNFTYPHNILVEFPAEWGWGMGGAYIMFFFLGGIGIFRMGSTAHILLLLFIFDFVNACASGDVTSPRLLYGLSIMGVAFQLAGGRRTAEKATQSA